jgi:hypothetical protein
MINPPPYPQLSTEIIGYAGARLALQIAETKCFYLPRQTFEKRVAAANLVPGYMPFHKNSQETLDLICTTLENGMDALSNPVSDENKNHSKKSFLATHAIQTRLNTDGRVIRAVKKWEIDRLSIIFQDGLENLSRLSNLAMELDCYSIARKIDKDCDELRGEQNILSDFSGAEKLREMLESTALMGPDITYLAAYKDLRLRSQASIAIGNCSPN